MDKTPRQSQSEGHFLLVFQSKRDTAEALPSTLKCEQIHTQPRLWPAGHSPGMENTAQGLASAIRENAEAIAELLFGHQASAPADPTPTDGPATWAIVDGDNGPAAAARCPDCDAELYCGEIFTSDKLDAERAWNQRRGAETAVAEHNAAVHSAGDRR